MGIVLMIHSIVRWLIVAVAVVALVRFALGLIQRSDYDGMSRGLVAGFSGLMDLQSALGLVFLLWSGLTGAGFPLYRIEHAVVMIAAAVVAHGPGRAKKASNASKSVKRTTSSPTRSRWSVKSHSTQVIGLRLLGALVKSSP